MEVKDFLWGLDSVTWSYDSESRKVELPNINFANIDLLNKNIYIVCGENFSDDQIYYLAYDGNVQLAYDKRFSGNLRGKL